MALNSSFTKHEDLYAEAFDVSAPQSDVVKEETKEEKEERLEIRAQNRERFEDYVKSNVKERPTGAAVVLQRTRTRHQNI